MILIVEQVYIFMYAILGGAIVAFLYDMLRIKRRAIKTGVRIVSLEDILYWFIAAIFLFVVVYKSNNGEMRGFMFIGIVIGVMLYESLLSSLIIKCSINVINIIKRILKFLYRILSYPIKLIYRIVYKIIVIPVRFIVRKLWCIMCIAGRKMGIIKNKAGLITKNSLKKIRVLRKKRKSA